MHKPNICISRIDPFISNTERIHVSCWTRDEIYESILINERSEGKYSQILTYNVVSKKLTYEEIDLKGEIVNIYQKPQALINYLIDTSSKEGDWVLDLFLGSCNILILHMKLVSLINIYNIFFNLCFIVLFNFLLYIW